ncbi:hypothetical protein PENSPDRAFT_757906 [Peniophora sp. CONT]|nr:hypothetical protein PENSPDRAFT_757906 [Peniophora sp. CONT]
MPLLSLPYDILEKLLCCLNARDVLVCGRVCKFLHDVITTSLPIRYTIALAACGMRDGLNHFENLAERVEKLERYELAWRELAWKESLRIELPIPCRHVYLADGYLLSIDSATSSVKLIRLPSPLRGSTYQEYNWDSPSEFLQGDGTVLMDPGHDLVAFLKPSVDSKNIIFHARTFTGEAHPLAGNSAMLSISRSPEAQRVERDSDKWTTLKGRYLIGDNDARHVFENGVRIGCPRIYDWTEGRDITPHLDSNVLCSMTFLDETHALCFVETKESVELWTADLERLDPEGRAVVTHIFQFSFPPGWTCLLPFGGCGTEVGLPPVTHRELGAGCYFEDDEWSAFSTPLRVRDEKENLRQFVLRVPFSVLRRFNTSTLAHLPTIIPYSTWSDANTLVEGLEQPLSAYGRRESCVRGSRIIWSRARSDALHILDLHPRRLARMGIPQTRSRKETFNVPTQVSNPAHVIFFGMSGDCLVVQEHNPGEGELDDLNGPAYAITVYSLA